MIGPQRQLTAERVVEQSSPGIDRFPVWLEKLAPGPPGMVAVAVERPRSAVVETLVERSLADFSISPKQLDRFRGRHIVAGAKDDRRGAFVLADSLRTDQPNFHRVTLDELTVLRSREWSQWNQGRARL